MDITFTLSEDEVKGLFGLLGQLPTSTNVWPLLAKLSQQLEAQFPSNQADEEKAA